MLQCCIARQKKGLCIAICAKSGSAASSDLTVLCCNAATQDFTGPSSTKTKRQEAKAAADAAAAAAADACAVCDKLYGEDADKDDMWIACDRCNRWYHGSCVDLTQVCLQRL